MQCSISECKLQSIKTVKLVLEKQEIFVKNIMNYLNKTKCESVLQNIHQSISNLIYFGYFQI